MESACACPLGELTPCRPQWFHRGWNCPYLWRPRDLQVRSGNVIRMGPDTRMWTERLGELQAEFYRARGLGDDLFFEVIEVYRTRDYTQAKVLDRVTQLPVWVNLWYRYDEAGRCRGVQWAVVLWRA